MRTASSARTAPIAFGLSALVLAAGTASAQTYFITPGGLLANNGTFRYTPPAGTITPAGVGSLTAGGALRTNYSFSPKLVASPGDPASVGDVAWQLGWFFRVQGENREFAFINAVTSTAAGITCTRTGSVGTNLGTTANCAYVYEVQRNVAGGYKFRSDQRFEILTTALGPATVIRNIVSNIGTVDITLNLYWMGDLDCQPNFGDDRFSVIPTGLLFRQNGVPNPSVFAARGNADRFAVRASAIPGFNTTIQDTMTNNIAENLLNNFPPVTTTVDDLSYGYQWTIVLPVGLSFAAETYLQHQSRSGCTLSDIAGPGGLPLPDGELTADDIILFIGWFIARDARADIAGPGGVVGGEGEFTADDIILFIGRFTAGC